MEALQTILTGWIIGTLAGLLFIGFCEWDWKRITRKQDQENKIQES